MDEEESGYDMDRVSPLVVRLRLMDMIVQSTKIYSHLSIAQSI